MLIPETVSMSISSISNLFYDVLDKSKFCSEIIFCQILKASFLYLSMFVCHLFFLSLALMDIIILITECVCEQKISFNSDEINFPKN